MRLMLNGRPYRGENGLQAFAGEGEKAPKATWKVKLTPGRHELAVQAISAVSRNNSEKIVVKCDTGTVAPPGRLFVLAVGISKYPEGIDKLDFADRDADSVLKKFRQKSQPAPYGKVVSKLLKNEEATRKAIFNALEEHKKDMTIDDSAIIFFSGHGKRSDKGKLYLLPVDANPDKLAETAVSAEELKKVLDDTRGRNILVILDACHSGAATSEFSEPSNDTVTDGLARDLGRDYDGLSVLCSSRAPQSSLEDRENKQGLFTQVLLDGLDGKGRYDPDGIVCNHHVLTYVIDTVRSKTKKQQLPTGTAGTMPLTRAK
jgi:uncharacterized caspase-like protein